MAPPRPENDLASDGRFETIMLFSMDHGTDESNGPLETVLVHYCVVRFIKRAKFGFLI